MQAVARAASRRCHLAPAVIARARAGGGLGMRRRGYCNDPRHKAKIHQLEVLREKIDDISFGVDTWINYAALVIGTYITVETLHYLYGDSGAEAPATTHGSRAPQETRSSK